MIKVSIENYKTIDSLQLDIKPVTILVGPPNTGKSNILEALYIAGIPGKLYMAPKEYEDGEELFCKRDGAIGRVLRLADPIDIFPDYNYENPAIIKTAYDHPKVESTIEIEAGIDELRVNLRVTAKEWNVILQDKEKIDKLEEGIILYKRNNYCIDLLELTRQVQRALQEKQYKHEYALSNLDPNTLLLMLLVNIVTSAFLDKRNRRPEIYNIGEVLLESRLYSYSRYMLDARLDSLLSCPNRGTECRIPPHVLAEDAGNIAWIAYRKPKAVNQLNKWLTESLAQELRFW
ncbi:MAG: ATP-binding protein [Desulfurococcales archaeon]|nr:ATP-binding protein [Desulfurococcales archaeon]